MSLIAVLLATALVSEAAHPPKSSSQQEPLDSSVMKRGKEIGLPRFKAVKDTSDGAGTCHPTCRWACNDPECPALCHPICEPPRCEVSCEQSPCAKCKVHCQKPLCSVRCPKSMCERSSCPKCQVICAPGQCHTKCSSPDPVCAPVCESPTCKWKCAKPAKCPRPKCQLQCQKATCEDTSSMLGGAGVAGGAGGCCPCDESGHAMAAIEMANEAHSNITDIQPMSLLEVMNHARHYHGKNPHGACCPCSKKGHHSAGKSAKPTFNVAKIAKTLS